MTPSPAIQAAVDAWRARDMPAILAGGIPLLEWRNELAPREAPPRYVTGPDKVLREIACAYWGLPQRTLFEAKLRTDAIVHKRWVVWQVARDIFGWSNPDIARHFGGHHHTTVIHGLRRLEVLLDAGWLLRDYQAITTRLEEALA